LSDTLAGPTIARPYPKGDRVIFLRVSALVLAAALLLASGVRPAAAQAEPKTFSPEQIQNIELIVRDYLMRHPEIILEAVDALEQKRKAEAEEQQRAALATSRKEIFEDASAPVLGAPNASVTLVEFFDYKCPYCKQMTQPMMRLLQADKDLRIVFKELPILGPDSVIAARAALAAQRQGKYKEMHEALMRTRGSFDEATVLRVANEVGLDIKKLKSDMEAPEFMQALERNRNLARELQITGTPAFIVGDRLVPGAVDPETLAKLIAEARKK
jgi:protein-disulfide isomerase